MRKICLILLSLAACQKDAGEEAATQAADQQQALLPSDGLPNTAPDPAQLQALVTRAIAAVVPNPKTARYRNVRQGAGGSACGDIAEGSGIFRPFVVTPEAMALVAATPTIAYDDPDDIFADAWIRWCATPEELRRIGPALKQVAESNVVETVPDPHIPLPGETDLPPPTPADRPPPPPVAAKAGPPPAIDSFFNSVQRQGE